MKTFSIYVNSINESKKNKQEDKTCNNKDCCQQVNNGVLGVTNHLTPVENIITNVRNLFCAMLGIVAEIAEDGVSIKLHSSQFVSDKSTYNVLHQTLYNSQSLYSYIISQGLDCCKLVNLGQYIVVYFSPSDIKTSVCNKEGEFIKPDAVPVKEMLEMNIDEAELNMIYEGEDDDDELEKLRFKQVNELIVTKDKVKAAKQFAALIGAQMSLPMEFYFCGVKSKDGDESIALRWRYTKRRPHNKSTEVTRTLINIFGVGDEAIWVQDFDKDAMFQLPDDVKKLIENILEFLNAEKTSDPCVYKIDSEEKKDEDKKKKEEEDKKAKEEEDDKTEDDKSRGDDSDNDDEDKSKDDVDDLLKI